MRNVLHCLLHQHQNSPQNQTVSVAEMVKKRVGGKARFAAALSGSGRKAAKVEAKEQAKDRPAPPKHLQRKIARKVGFLEKVAASKVTLKGRVQKRQRKNDVGKALGGLRESLGGALQEVERQHAEHQDKHKQMGEAVKSSKARLKIQQTETARVKQVLQHPAFKASPIEAITRHLQNTLPPAPSPATQQKGGKKSKKAAGSGQRGAGGPQKMVH